jgi:uncharacterized protein
MKYLFWVLVIGLVWWVFRTRRKAAGKAPAAPETASPQDMARCGHCGIHLPHDEAVRGENGLYCSTEHRLAAQDRNPQ